MAVLQRWQDAGAHWAVIARHKDSITIGLYRCDGGEEAELLVSEDADLLGWLGGRTSSEQ